MTRRRPPSCRRKRPAQDSSSLGVQTGRTGRIDDSSGSAIDQNRVGRATGVVHGTLPEDSGRQSSSDDERDTTERGVAYGLTKAAAQQCATGFGTQENSGTPPGRDNCHRTPLLACASGDRRRRAQRVPGGCAGQRASRDGARRRCRPLRRAASHAGATDGSCRPCAQRQRGPGSGRAG